MTETTYETHIPRVGRHGYLVEFKDDRTRCMHFRAYLANPDAKFRNAEHRKNYELSAHDDNDMCDCPVFTKGMVWSRLMSDPLPEEAQENVDYYFGQQPPQLDFQDFELEELEQVAQHEQFVRQTYMSEYVSLASGDRYGSLM